MPSDTVERRLAAIFAADMVGFSRLMEADEDGTIARQKAHLKELFEPAIAEHNGRIVKTTGDGLLVEFASAVNAVQCAVAVQRGMGEREAGVAPDQRIDYRIGINVGEIVIDGDDILGDGVNVAARLEALADAGGICISDAVFRNVRGKTDIGFEDLGPQRVKNLAEPVTSYRVRLDPAAGGDVVSKRRSNRTPVYVAAAALVAVVAGVLLWQPWSSTIERASAARMKFPLPSKPSIAVLPFENLSKDKGQDFFASGITEDIITDLSKISGLFVVSQHSTRGYKGKVIKIRQVAEQLGVRYVLSGSVRRAGDKIRVTARLIDAIKGGHLWSGRYDRQVKDVFAVQSELTKRVVKAMAVTLKAREHDRVFQKYVTNIEAYDAWQRARKTVEVPRRKNIIKGEALFQRTIELDPKFAGGYAGLAFNYSVKARFRYGASREEDVKLALAYAKKAIEVDPEFAWSHIAMAGAHLAAGSHDAAVDAAGRALAIQPGGYETNLFMGFYLFWAMHSARAVKHLEFANKLNRQPAYRDLIFLGIAYVTDGKYAKAEAVLLRAQRLVGNVKQAGYYIFLVAAQVAQNKMAEARVTVSQLNRVHPEYRVSKFGNLKTFKSEAFKRQMVEWAVKAGIPE